MKKITAREFMKKFVLKYVKDNWEKLNKINKGVDDKIFIDLKDDGVLDWILEEVLMEKDFKEMGITLESGWHDDIYIAIFKINNQFIRMSFKQKDNYVLNNYDFVKLVEKTIVVKEYETIK